MRKLAFAGAVVAAAFAVPAVAQSFYAPPPQSWYLDLGAGRGKVKVDDFSETKTAWAARLGYRFHPNFAVDAGYYDWGKLGDGKFTSWGASVVAIAPLDAFDIYGRIGYVRTKVEASGDSADKSTALYGAGGRYMFSPQLGVYVEYLYQKPEDVKIEAWMAGVQFRF